MAIKTLLRNGVADWFFCLLAIFDGLGQCFCTCPSSLYLEIGSTGIIIGLARCICSCECVDHFGAELLQWLESPAIILTTAYRDFAPEAFDLDVVDYLLKPISFERFTKSINKIFDKRLESKSNEIVNPSKEDAFIYLKSDRKNHKVLLKEIIYIESLDDYVKVHLKDVTLVTRENISSFEANLPSSSFVRIHRSFIINTQFLASISSDGIEIAGKELPIGRAFKKSAMASLLIRDKKE